MAYTRAAREHLVVEEQRTLTGTKAAEVPSFHSENSNFYDQNACCKHGAPYPAYRPFESFEY